MDIKKILQFIRTEWDTGFADIFDKSSAGRATRLARQVPRFETNEILQAISPTINMLANKPPEKIPFDINEIDKMDYKTQCFPECEKVLSRIDENLLKQFQYLCRNGQIVDGENMKGSACTCADGSVYVGKTDTCNDVDAITHEVTHSYLLHLPRITCEIMPILVTLLTADETEKDGFKGLFHEQVSNAIGKFRTVYTMNCAVEMCNEAGIDLSKDLPDDAGKLLKTVRQPKNAELFNAGYNDIMERNKPNNGGIFASMCHEVGVIFAVSIYEKIKSGELTFADALKTMRYTDKMTPNEQLTKLGILDKDVLAKNMAKYLNNVATKNRETETEKII